ncbi:MAG: hypothetical protein H7Y60_09140 [Rhodospirillaceae bacterium]|nr:hypothetical protein [Rhodospirillales bacterium]
MTAIVITSPRGIFVEATVREWHDAGRYLNFAASDDLVRMGMEHNRRGAEALARHVNDQVAAKAKYATARARADLAASRAYAAETEHAEGAGS